jgi:hypothetical protein
VDIGKWHTRLLIIWMGPGLAVSVACVLFTSQKVILIWNLILSLYTIGMEHFLGRRQEADD